MAEPILKGKNYKMPRKKTKPKKYIIRTCPKCKSDDVGLAIGGQIGMWECRKCGMKAASFAEKEMTEEEFLEYQEKKGDLDFEFTEPQTVSEKKSHKEMLKEKQERGEEI